jgi:hypothetical protein
VDGARAVDGRAPTMHRPGRRLRSLEGWVLERPFHKQVASSYGRRRTADLHLAQLKLSGVSTTTKADNIAYKCKCCTLMCIRSDDLSGRAMRELEGHFIREQGGRVRHRGNAVA